MSSNPLGKLVSEIVRTYSITLHILALTFWRSFPWPGGRGRYAMKNWIFRGREGQPPLLIPVDIGYLWLAWTDDNLERTIYATGQHYEKPVVDLALGLELDGKTVLDIGAHVGYYSLLFARAVGPEGTLVAFEPQPRLAEAVGASLGTRSNGIFCRFRVEPRALGDHEGVLRLHCPADSGRTSATPMDDRVETLEVPVSRADQWIDEHLDGRVDLLKIDVEGAELSILRGLEGLFARGSRPTLLIEVHPPQITELGGSADELVELLRGLGYRLRYIPVGRSASGAATDLPDPLPAKATWHLIAEADSETADIAER